MKHTVIGMDIAKHIFQLHRVDPVSGEVERIKLKRARCWHILHGMSRRWWPWKAVVVPITGGAN